MEAGTPELFIEIGMSWESAALQKCPGIFFKKVNPQGLGEGLRSAGQCGLSCTWSCKWPGEQGSGRGRAVHGGQEVSDLSPLGRADVLAHVHHAVQGHLRVFLHQAAGDGRERLESLLPRSSVGLKVAPRIPVQGHVTFLGGQQPGTPEPLPAVVTVGTTVPWGRREYDPRNNNGPYWSLAM